MSGMKILIKINLWILSCISVTFFISIFQFIYGLESEYYLYKNNRIDEILTLFSQNSQTVSFTAAIFSFDFIKKISNNYLELLYNSKKNNISISIAIEKVKNSGLIDSALSLILIITFFLIQPFAFNENTNLYIEFIKYYTILFIRFILLMFFFIPYQLNKYR